MVYNLHKDICANKHVAAKIQRKVVFMGTVQRKTLVEYIVICISEYAVAHSISLKDAFFYLSKYKALDFLEECYDAEHTLSFTQAVEDMDAVCARNGGVLA